MFLQDNSFTQGTLGFPLQEEEDHELFADRLRKTLYYGKLPGTDRPSLPLTDIAVEFFQDAAPRPLGKLDTYLASSTSRSACMSPASMMVGMMYVRRLKKRRPDYLTQISSSELFLISMMMASKFLYDEGIDDEVFNDEWAESGDLEVDDINQLERDFLSAIDWQLFVRQEDFTSMLDMIEKRIALQQGLQRGWFTYTDLYVLTTHNGLPHWRDILTELSKVMSVSSIAYVAGLLTLIGSTVLGTTASTSFVTFGTQVLPVYCRGLTFPLEVIPGSRSLLDIERSTEENTELPHMDFGVDDVLLDRKTTGNQTDNLGVQNKGWVPATMMTDNNETIDKVAEEISQSQRPHRHGLNGFLSSFITLVTLKDALVDFASAVYSETTGRDQKQESSKTHPSDNLDCLKDPDEICSAGPCLHDSWPHCWNVSSEHDWTQFKAYNARCQQDGKWDNSHRLVQDINVGATPRCYGDGGGLGRSHCCCRVCRGRAYSDQCGSVNTPLQDWYIGFTTSSAMPLLVTTQ